MDMDVRRAVRFIEAAGFNGLSKEETERFVELGKNRLKELESEMGFVEGDDIKYIVSHKNYYGRVVRREGSLWVKFIGVYSLGYAPRNIEMLKKLSSLDLSENNSIEKVHKEALHDLISRRLKEISW